MTHSQRRERKSFGKFTLHDCHCKIDENFRLQTKERNYKQFFSPLKLDVF